MIKNYALFAVVSILSVGAISCSVSKTEVPPLKDERDMSFPERVTKGIVTSVIGHQQRR